MSNWRDAVLKHGCHPESKRLQIGPLLHIPNASGRKKCGSTFAEDKPGDFAREIELCFFRRWLLVQSLRQLTNKNKFKFRGRGKPGFVIVFIDPDFLFMDENARLCRSVEVSGTQQSKNIQYQWSAYSSDLNPIEHA
ncbi:hypothetical protein TNCV_4884421 [Trichonephila clavipes]|nr:hypothetical protein TNCV_4884421 [Trichonephila clavipes]